MNAFAIAAAVMALVMLALAWSRPRRVAFVVAAALWLLYANYERQVANGVLCDANCNIRVDLLLFLPILMFATLNAFRAGYEIALGVLIVAVAALLVALFGAPISR